MKNWNRRDFIKVGLVLGGLGLSGTFLFRKLTRYITPLISNQEKKLKYATFIGKVSSYRENITSVILSGFKELGVRPEEIRGKRILLKQC